VPRTARPFVGRMGGPRTGAGQATAGFRCRRTQLGHFTFQGPARSISHRIGLAF
jgi:hypothetical protein